VLKNDPDAGIWTEHSIALMFSASVSGNQVFTAIEIQREFVQTAWEYGMAIALLTPKFCCAPN
jgi:hypothetical protein